MAGTRSSTRQASQEKPDYATGSKRKGSSTASPESKRGKKNGEQQQMTIESSMSLNKQPEDVEMSEPPKTESDEKTPNPGRTTENVNSFAEENRSSIEAKKDGGEDNAEGDGKIKQDTDDEKQNAEKQAAELKKNEDSEHHPANEATGSKVSDVDNAVETSKERESAVPSTILEKGIIYFFFRGRVGIDEPSGVADIARSYIILRPLPKGAELGDGPIGDAKTNKLLALPKKVLPKSPKDRFMTFVEKANISMDEIKETLSSSDYTTQTSGARHSPAAAPIGEGVYAITETGRDTHLAYKLTIPIELREVQSEVGLAQQGSFHTSVKNPKSSGPASAQLPQSADFPKEIMDAFGGRGWMPLRPEMLNYENCQFLIIGSGDGALEKAAEPQHGEENKPDKETPLEEVEKLENEDELRVKHLEGDNSVFADLGLESQEYPKLQTTW